MSIWHPWTPSIVPCDGRWREKRGINGRDAQDPPPRPTGTVWHSGRMGSLWPLARLCSRRPCGGLWPSVKLRKPDGKPTAHIPGPRASGVLLANRHTDLANFGLPYSGCRCAVILPLSDRSTEFHHSLLKCRANAPLQ
jgi:hypothetical protein